MRTQGSVFAVEAPVGERRWYPVCLTTPVHLVDSRASKSLVLALDNALRRVSNMQVDGLAQSSC